MIFKPRLLGTTSMTNDELAADRKAAAVIGPCAVGEKALYVNSFYISRFYYVCYKDISRVFKRVAMSRGGYTGKGVFGSIPYLVVQMKDGREKQCNFKFEDQVDKILALVSEEHPEIPVHSRKAEERLEKAKHEREAKYIKNLSPEAEKSLEALADARENLENRSILYRQLAYAAKQKRIQDHISPSYRVMAILLAAAGAVLALYGVWAFMTKSGFALISLMIGLALLAVIMATRVLPTGTRNKKQAQADWDQAVSEMDSFLSKTPYIGGDFPVPPQYAHPIVLDRMTRIIREGRAETAEEALAVLKTDLKALNKSVRVSQEEYDEVVTIKPMFLVCDYK